MMIDDHRLESATTCLPRWAIKTIEAARPNYGNMSIGPQNCSKKQYFNISLMTHVPDTYDPDTYICAQGVLEWENVMTTEIYSMKKNQTWVIVPPPKERMS